MQETGKKPVICKILKEKFKILSFGLTLHYFLKDEKYINHDNIMISHG